MKRLLLIGLVLSVLISCKSEEEKEQKALVKAYEETGKAIVKASFESMSGHLKAAMEAGGPSNAIQYCNVNAVPLTDSLAKKFNVKIKRSSHILRNQKNAPDALEEYMIDLYQDLKKMKKPMEPKGILAESGDVRFFAPIMVKEQCLKCHGTVGKEVSDDTYAIIEIKYPEDQAIGYAEGDFRGIWSINFGSYEELKAKEELSE
ncbi:MAG: DUF3365 domain-containing protein [Bacteroidota bacterium]